MGNLPGLAGFDGAFEEGNGAWCVPLAEINLAEERMRGDEAERMVGRFGDPNGVLASPDALGEFAPLGIAQGRLNARDNCRQDCLAQTL